MIYITELTTTSPRQFPTKQKYSTIFQVSDILHTGTEIKHDIICLYHPYHTK